MLKKTETPLSPDHFQTVARLFRVLADPTRLMLLHELKKSPAHVTALTQRTGFKQANVSKQLGILHDAGLLKRERQGNQIHYSISHSVVFELCRIACERIHDQASQAVELHKQTLSTGTDHMIAD